MSVDQILLRQAGVISRAQALDAGLSPAAVDRHVRLRRWRPLHPRVYRADGAAAGDMGGAGDEARVRAALLWAGPGAVLSGVAAAWWHGIVERAPAVVRVAVPPRCGLRDRSGVGVRCRVLATADVIRCRGVPVTARPLTVLDAAVELGAPGVALLDRALGDGLSLPELLAAHRRAGSAGSRWLLAAVPRVHRCPVTSSALEQGRSSVWTARRARP